MRCSRRVAAIGICLGVVTGLQACQYYVPDLDGTYVAHSADIQADRNTLNDILSAFKRAEAALHRRDVDDAFPRRHQQRERVVPGAEQAADQRRLELHHRVPGHGHNVRSSFAAGCDHDHWARLYQAIDLG